MAGPASFAYLVAEGAAEPVAGWDFSWFAGRATEERPAWGYAGLLGERMAHAKVALDVQTGGGEVLAKVPRPAPVLVATESWPPNLAVARRNLHAVAAALVQASDDGPLPFQPGTFDLVASRHPTVVVWPEIPRVGAVVYFLRKVLWTVPGFTVGGYRAQLARMHEHIRDHGSFVSHAQRFLIEARKPA